MFKTKKERIFFILAGFFITNAVVAELIGGKLISVGPWSGWGPWNLSIGILPWPIVFLTTDLTNEYFGQKGVRQLTLLTTGLIVYTFLVIWLAMGFPAASFSPVSNEAFSMVFGQSMSIILASLVAFMMAQFVDVFVFWFVRNRTGNRLLWLRATGSTVVSQGIDTFMVQGLAFYVPGKINFEEWVSISWNGYSAKLLIAVMLTPLIYLAHYWIDKYLAAEKDKVQG
jgi:queuosine precursor transporter